MSKYATLHAYAALQDPPLRRRPQVVDDYEPRLNIIILLLIIMIIIYIYIYI